MAIKWNHKNPSNRIKFRNSESDKPDEGNKGFNWMDSATFSSTENEEISLKSQLGLKWNPIESDNQRKFLRDKKRNSGEK